MKLLTAGLLLAAAEAADNAEQVGEAAEWSALDHSLVAVGLIVAATLLIVAEMLIISFGVLGIGAAVCAYFAIVHAFAVHAAFGWALIVASPAIAVLAITWGLNRLGKSSLVPQSTVSDHAGASHIAARIGIEVGSRGELITDAYPGGRARFAGGICDVQARGGALEAGTPVVVKRIDGPMVFVAADPEAGGHAAANSQTEEQ